MTSRVPTEGQLVRVRGEQWVVSQQIEPRPGSTLLELQSVADGRYGETLKVIWEVEPGRAILPAGSLPDVASGAFDHPERLAAFLDAVRWSAVTSADVKTLQSPFRAGVRVENYQLEPVARAVESPRVNLLLADDVGLGKTVEAGLVAEELLLRHRTRKVLVVCPAGLTVKWKDEMAEKFGLTFTVIDTELCAKLRRTHGSAANPFRVYPLAIVSLPWLRGPKGQRLLDEVLADDPEEAHRRPFGLLILDEAHHVAPAAPKQAYAVDSQQTKLLRRMAPHFEHRLFLSATPHNGYQQSFTALLELVDDQKFARGVPPDETALRETVVRRLKTHIVDDQGRRKFHERKVMPLAVEYPEEERALHAQLAAYAELRKRRVRRSTRGRKAADLVTLLLKKRFFSSPDAFATTVGVYLETLKAQTDRKKPSRSSAAASDVPEWLESFAEDVSMFDDEELHDAENDALRRAQSLQADDADDADGAGELRGMDAADSSADQDQKEIAALERMLAWAQGYENRPDAKAAELISYLKAVCLTDDGYWTNERVVVFTEYRDTQTWLQRLLLQTGAFREEGRLQLLHGGMDADDREDIRQAFQSDPSSAEGRVRVLLATDAASEGIDLQDFCHRLVNYDIPFNPNKLEQRIGRIDRYGQDRDPQIYHFIGTGRKTAYEDDLEFLTRVVHKVAQMEEDLGTINAVLADAVQRRMAGEAVDFDDAERRSRDRAKRKGGGTVQAETSTEVGEAAKKRRAEYEATVAELGITPHNVQRVVTTALELAKQPPLLPYDDADSAQGELFDIPPLTGSFSRASDGMIDRLTERQRHVTFDPDVAFSRHKHKDTILAHLSHPLVAMSVKLLRAAVWNEKNIGLHRATAVVSDDPALEDRTLIGAYARFLLVGTDGVRLHEEVLYAGGWLPANSRFQRLENLTTLGGILDRALTHGKTAAPHLQARMAEAWPRAQDGVVRSLAWRKEAREQSLEGKLAVRQDNEAKRVEASLGRFEATLRSALDDFEDDDALFSKLEVREPKEQAQARKDRAGWEDRLARLGEVRDRELAAIAARYESPQSYLFPVAVVCVIPKSEAVR